MPWSRPIHHPGRSLAALVVVAALTGTSEFLASTATAALATNTPTFTNVSGAYNPELSGSPFNVRALECDRVATVHPTGKMTFTDVTTGKSLGSVSLRGGSPFANCSQALITDREKLRQGNYRIRAVYTPGGRTPVHKSSGSYIEIIQ
ncbi:MAG: hypothetical protein ACLQNG_17860 [Acidimicrobiales bacterium]|jgi:hypothetical protein